jgi:hypothetical protein
MQQDVARAEGRFAYNPPPLAFRREQMRYQQLSNTKHSNAYNM